MLRKLLLIFILICMTKCKRHPYYSVENLYAILDRTTEYFQRVNNVYESSNVEEDIAKYMETTSKMMLQRQKRSDVRDDLQPSEKVNVLQGFEETLTISNLPDSQDIALFSVQNGSQLLWLAAAVNSSNILLYQLFDSTSEQHRTATILATYPQPNGKRIKVNNYGTDTLAVVQTSTNEIVILRLGKTDTYEFQFKQELEIPDVVNVNMWFGMNQLYLGIVSDTKVLIYTWLGEHFDQIDTLYSGGKELLFFQQKSFMHVILVGSLTRIFRFSVRSDKFVETQKLQGTRDANLFHFKEGRFEERFLALADDNSTTFYKEMYNRFVPFYQRFSGARYLFPLTISNTMILLAATEEGDAVVYQYDGWKFVELHVKLSNVRRILQIRLHSGDMLAVQSQTGEWKFLRPIWTATKTWRNLRSEIKTWCSEVKRKASRRESGEIMKSRNLIKLPGAHIGQLRARNINDHNATELIRLTEQYRRTISKLNVANKILTQKIRGAGESSYTVLHGKKITVRCGNNCHVHRLNISSEVKLVHRSSTSTTLNQTFKLDNLKIKTINNWKCPVPSFVVDDVFVKESVNGVLMKNLEEGTLKISGDQQVSGEHSFGNLRATNVSIPLNIATNSTTVPLRMFKARVKELYLVVDEFFLPLNGSIVTMTGSITTKKAKVTGLVNSMGAITGKTGRDLKLLTEIDTPLTVPYDCFLQNVTFRNIVKARDIVSPRKTSLKRILEDSVPLDSDVPTELILSSDKIQWNNVTILDYKNWITKNSTDTVIISGTKHASNNVVLANVTYKNLPIPKLTVSVCAEHIITQDVTTSLITVDDLTARNLNVLNVTGARELNDTMFVSTSSLQSVNISTKRFAGRVIVKNISASEIKGVDVKELKKQVSKWIDVDRIKGPVNASKLLVENLQKPVNVNLFLPVTVNTVIIRGDSNIGRINGLNMSLFIENVQKVSDEISLDYATFVRGFESNNIQASRSTLNLSQAYSNLHSKRIRGTLKASTIKVPQIFSYAASNLPSTFVIEGTARFAREPTVRYIKDVNLQKLSKDLWMSDQNTVISGNNMYLRNMFIQEKVFMHNAANSLNINVWLNLSNKLLSKTKQQNITAAATFTNVVAATVIASNDSTLQTSDPDLKNLLTNTWMRDNTKAQIVDATWHFDELNIDNLYWNGKFNDIDLNTEIVRYDVEKNIITGKKMVADLSTEELWSHNNEFSKFVKYALSKTCRNITTIRGQKTFKNLSLNNLSVKGKLMGRSIEQALLKSRNQTVLGIKRIHGHLNASSLITNSTVNNVTLTKLINDQLKSHELEQTIESEMIFQKDIEVFGNVTFNRFYGDMDVGSIIDNSALDDVSRRTMEVLELADDIKTGLHSPASYVAKFEQTEEDATKITSDPTIEDMIVLNSSCVCEPKNLSEFCNDTKLLNILDGKNSSTLKMTSLVKLDGTVFVVMVSSDFISIYTYAAGKQVLRQKAELHMPDILQASVEPTDHALWIVVRLPRQTLVLRYQAWNEFEQYVLPASDILVTSRTPYNQHLLVLSDGVWNLGGVFHPEHIFKLPLNGEVRAFALGADYYVKITKKNSTTLLKARYVGN